MSRVGEVESAEAFFDWVAEIVARGLRLRRALHPGRRARRLRLAAAPERRLGALALGGPAPLRTARPSASLAAAVAPTRAAPRAGAHRAVRRLVGGARGRSTRRRSPASPPASDDEPRPDAGGGPARRVAARPALPRLRRSRRDAARQPRRRRPPPSRRHVLRRRRVAAADGDARSRRAGPSARPASPGSRRTRPTKGCCRSRRRTTLLAPEHYEPWVAKWGPPPCPLLWSHAMFLTLAHELGA